MKASLKRCVVAAVAVPLLVLLGGAATAFANVQSVTIDRGSPISQITLGNELSCQVKLLGDSVNAFFPSSQAPGDCGTIVKTGGTTYGPDFANHVFSATSGLRSSNYTPFTPVSQSGVTGSGTGADPYTVTTVVDAGSSGLRLSERTTYVSGETSFNSQITITNIGLLAANATLYRAGDCYLAGSDYGYGALKADNSALCTQAPDDSPPGRVVGFRPVSGGPSHRMQGQFRTVWTRIHDSGALPDTCGCGVFQDNGAALSWDLTIGGFSNVVVDVRTLTTPPILGAPVNQTRPTISGDVVVPNTLHGSSGNWSGTQPIGFEYQWQRCVGSGDCSDITGATSQDYELTGADTGKSIRLLVVASNSAGETTAVSSQTDAVVDDGSPVNTARPTISGDASVGGTLSADPGQWVGADPIDFGYQWVRCTNSGPAGNVCVDIGGATGQTYQPTLDDVNSKIKVRVTGTNTAGHRHAESDLTATVPDPRVPTNTVRPTISGNPTNGSTLTVDPGTWTGVEPIQFSYQWQRCTDAPGGPICVDVPHATDPSYSLTDSDLSYSIRAVVYAVNPAGYGNATSAAVGPVTGAPDCPTLLAFGRADGCHKQPIIFIPGFLGTEIECEGRARPDTVNLWPFALHDPTDYPSMELRADGRTPPPSIQCETSARAGGLVRDAFGVADVYGDAQDFLARIAPSRAYTFPWDFRKSVGDSLAALNYYIDILLSAHHVDKVVIMTHSQGGLLTHWYVSSSQANADKIARVADFSTPFWGSPKGWMAIAHGAEMPSYNPFSAAGSKLDPLTIQAEFKATVENWAGLYGLLPSASTFKFGQFGRYLQVGNDVAQSTADVAHFIDRAGANPTLANQAAAAHAAHLDGFHVNGVDFELIVGTGEPTIGAFHEPRLGPEMGSAGPIGVDWTFLSGDGTVPMQSARQFTSETGVHGDGLDNPLGDDVPVHYFCDVGHTSETEDRSLQVSVADFLLSGHSISGGRIRPAPCPLNGISVTSSSAATVAEEGGSTRTRAKHGPMGLKRAEDAGLIDVVESSGRTVFVTTTHASLTVTISDPSAGAIVTPVTDAGNGKPITLAGGGSAPLKLKLEGSNLVGARRGGNAAHPVAADHRPPLTRVTIQRQGVRSILHINASDASGIAHTFLVAANGRLKKVGAVSRVKTRSLPHLRIFSVDGLGNVEAPHRLIG